MGERNTKMQQVAIVGGGQLGMLLCQAAQELGVASTILCDADDAPATHYADKVIVADEQNSEAIQQLIGCSSHVTFEKEAVAESLLDQLSDADSRGDISVAPTVHIMRLIKDKGLQKQWLQERGFPVVPFRVIDGHSALQAEPELLAGPWVQKARQGGYDGKAVQILRSPEGIQDYWDTPSILEQFLPDNREIAVLTARNSRGELATYPVVDMAFDPKLNALSVASAPSSLPEEITQAACKLAEDTVTALDGVGVFSVEMFIDDADTLFINEIAPRVHNSGHLTLELCTTSQFEQHLRVITGMTPGPTSARGCAAMVNLLYSEGMESSFGSDPERRFDTATNAMIYWYGKAAGTPGRKMGHITALANTVDEAVENALKARDSLNGNGNGDNRDQAA